MFVVVSFPNKCVLCIPPPPAVGRRDRDILLQLLDDPSEKIRKQAVLTCCQVLVQPGKPQFVTGPSAYVSCSRRRSPAFSSTRQCSSVG